MGSNGALPPRDEGGLVGTSVQATGGTMTEAQRKKKAKQHLARVFLRLAGHSATAEALFDEEVARSEALVPRAAVEHAPTRMPAVLNQWLACAPGSQGRGLRAARDIPYGSVILVEPAFAVRSLCGARRRDPAQSRPAVDVARWLVHATDGDEPQSDPQCTTTHALALALARAGLREHGAARLTAVLAAYHPALMGSLPTADAAAAWRAEADTLARETGLSAATAVMLLHTVGRTMVTLEAGPSHLRYGSALFPATALANHSCLPNARCVYLRHYSVLFAVRPIARGDPVTVSYAGMLTAFALEPRHLSARREMVRAVAGFDCRCDLCVAQERHSDVSAPWGTAQAAARYAIVQHVCHARPGVTLSDRLHILTNYLRPPAPSAKEPPLDDFARLALMQWYLFFSIAAWEDPVAYRAHAGNALVLLPRLVRELVIYDAHGEAVVTYRIEALTYAMYGLVRAYERVRGVGASMGQLERVARRSLSLLALARTPPKLAMLRLLAASSVDQIVHVFSLAANILLAKATRHQAQLP